MSETGALPKDEMPQLYTRIRFDPVLETRAFSLLAELDVDGCRASLAKLLDRLDFSTAGVTQRGVVGLLLDLLLKVNSRVLRVSSSGPAHHAQRVALIERFARYDDPEDARQDFIPALNRVLSLLGPTAEDVRPRLVENAQRYVEENYQHQLSLATLAAHLHVSRDYFSRLFHRQAGITLTAYIHRVRLDHARLLLVSGHHSISEVAYLVGYQNYRDFYRNFVKYERSSPRELKRRLLAASSDPSGGSPAKPARGAAR